MLMASATAGLRRSSTPTASRIRASRPTSCASSASKAATRTSTARCWLATAAGGRSTRRDREPEQRGAACDPHAGHFPNDRAATKLIYLTLRGVEWKWRAPPTFWHAARIEFAIHFDERFAMVAS